MCSVYNLKEFYDIVYLCKNQKEVVIMLALFDSFLQFDLAVFQWIQSIQNEFLDMLMVFITTLGNAGAVFIVLGLGLLFTKKYRKAGFSVIVALLIMLICNDLFLKEFFARPRPFNLFELNPEKYAFWGAEYVYPELVGKPSSFSFPSGHTASAFAAAIALLWHDRKLGVPVTVFAALMGFSRIYVEVHYCTDVIAGVISGTVCALIAVLVAKFVFPVLDNSFTKLSEKRKTKA